jgi:hypothetical protein
VWLRAEAARKDRLAAEALLEDGVVTELLLRSLSQVVQSQANNVITHEAVDQLLDTTLALATIERSVEEVHGRPAQLTHKQTPRAWRGRGVAVHCVAASSAAQRAPLAVAADHRHWMALTPQNCLPSGAGCGGDRGVRGAAAVARGAGRPRRAGDDRGAAGRAARCLGSGRGALVVCLPDTRRLLRRAPRVHTAPYLLSGPRRVCLSVCLLACLPACLPV